MNDLKKDVINFDSCARKKQSDLGKIDFAKEEYDFIHLEDQETEERMELDNKENDLIGEYIMKEKKRGLINGKIKIFYKNNSFNASYR